MPILRLLLLLGIAGFLLLFAMQNWTPAMQLVFLGARSPAFPLALWVLGAIAAGILTTLVISGLFRLTGFANPRRVQGRRRPTSFPQPPSNSYSYQPPAREPEPTRTWTAPPSQAKTSATHDEDSSDWDEDASDWFEDESDDRPQNWEDSPRTRPRTDYEVRQDPKSGSRSGSTYSYSYRDPENPRVDDTKSVVDADFRVIVPPYRNLDDEKKDTNEEDFE
jgi:uncharacterized integral membrane protein